MLESTGVLGRFATSRVRSHGVTWCGGCTHGSWLCKPDAVAAVRFRLIEGQIRLAQNLFHEMEIPISARENPQTHRNGERSARRLHWMAGDPIPHLFGTRECLAGVTIVENN